MELFKRIGGNAIPRLDAVAIGWPVLACGLGSAVLAALLAGLFPERRQRNKELQRIASGARNAQA